MDNFKYAHSIKFRPRDEWHRLEDHLSETARLAGSFAAEFGATGLRHGPEGENINNKAGGV